MLTLFLSLFYSNSSVLWHLLTKSLHYKRMFFIDAQHVKKLTDLAHSWDKFKRFKNIPFNEQSCSASDKKLGWKKIWHSKIYFLSSSFMLFLYFYLILFYIFIYIFYSFRSILIDTVKCAFHILNVTIIIRLRMYFSYFFTCLILAFCLIIFFFIYLLV